MRINLKRKQKIAVGVSVALIALSTSAVMAINGINSSGAAETPIETKVDGHEARITKAEEDIKNTNSRVGAVEQKTEANAQATSQLQGQVAGVQQQSNATAGQVQRMQQGTAPASTTPQSVQATPAAESAPQQVAAPVNPRLITNVTASPQLDNTGTQYAWICSYQLSGTRAIAVIQTAPCQTAGSDLNNDVAVANGVGR